MKKLSFVLLISVLIAFFSAGMAPFPEPRYPLDVFTVDVTDDSNSVNYQICSSAPNDCSLRGAIIKSNSTIDVVDTIIVPAGIYSLNFEGAGDDNNVSGDLDIFAPVTIIGAGKDSTIIEACITYDTCTDRVIHIFNIIGTVTISDLTIKNGKISSGAGGAGIYQSSSSSTVSLQRILVGDNRIASSVGGGGILAKGNLNIIDSTIMDNSTYGDGGGINADTGSQITINRTTFAFNDASRGGGLMVFDTATLRNVTVYHNSALLGGGGISQWDDSVMSLYNVTLNDNYLFSSIVSGWAIENYGSISSYASIISTDTSKYPCLNATISGFSNLSSNTGCGSGFIVADPMLDSLLTNGGYTQTCGLMHGSPAIDGGDNSYCLLEDQRGIRRPLDGNGDGIATCDIGSYEAYPVAGFLPLIRKP
jgi:hypothetical protein